MSAIPIWVYAVPIAVIILIVLVMMPIMKKKAGAATAQMDIMKDMKVHITMLAGNLKSINGHEESTLTKTYAIYATDETGDMTIEFTPNFTWSGTTYTGRSPMSVQFRAEEGHSYEISVSAKEPKNDPTVIDVSEVTSSELIFKNKFYMITKDVTDTANAKAMRGIF